MIPYSQKNKKWANRKMGDTHCRMKRYGCFVTALAIVDGRTPDKVLDILNRSNCFTSEGELLSETAAKVLGLEYHGVEEEYPGRACIAETADYANVGVPQHFFVWIGNGNIIDPLDGKIKKECYNVVTYRLIYKPPLVAGLPKERKGDRTCLEKYFIYLKGWFAKCIRMLRSIVRL